MSLGLFFFAALPCSIFGIVLSRSGRRRVDAGATTKHRGLAQAGFVLGIVMLVLSLLAGAIWIALFASDPDLLDDSQRNGLPGGPDIGPPVRALAVVLEAGARLAAIALS
jgi:hypothetical protein